MTPPPRRRGGPSLTAQAIAAGRAVGLRDLHDPMAADVLSDGRRRMVRALRGTIEGSPTGETVVNTLTAGLAGHAAFRMAAVDASVREALADGCRQLVVLGAGYDTRAWRMRELAGCHVVEVDLPETQAIKQRRLSSRTPVTPVVFAAADLSRDTLVRALADTGHDLEQPTLWLWEAVAPYLPAAAVRETVEAVAALSTPGSHVVMTVARPELLGTGPVSRLLSPAARGLFAGIGEPLRSTHTDEDVTALLTGVGFVDVVCTGAAEWAHVAGRTPLPDPFAAERLVTARR